MPVTWVTEADFQNPARRISDPGVDWLMFNTGRTSRVLKVVRGVE